MVRHRSSPRSRLSSCLEIHGRINHPGPHTNVRRGAFLIRVARIFSGVHISSPKSWRHFWVVVTFQPRNLWFLNVLLKIWQLLIGGHLAAGAPCHGTTGTVVNPALWKYRQVYWLGHLLIYLFIQFISPQLKNSKNNMHQINTIPELNGQCGTHRFSMTNKW